MKIKNVIYIFLVFSCFISFLPSTAFSELKSMEDNEMSAVYAEGFSSFSIVNNPVTGYDETIAQFNIYTDQYTTIDSLKLGYHAEYDYKDPTPIAGWDEDWTNVEIGGDLNDPSQDFHTEGLFFKAAFTDINDPTQRELKSITFGANYAQGPITADFNKFSGTIDDSANSTPEYNGHGLVLGTKTITADPTNSHADSSFSLSLSIGGFDKGYWVNFTKATVTP